MKYGEVTHFSHPEHKLRFEHSEVPFRCDGCREVGLGSRFKCPLCEDFDLHTQCASASPSSSPLRHPFFPKCLFHFLPRPPSASPRFCNACGRGLPAFLYHCRSCGFDLHPCCAALPHLLHAGPNLRLTLHPRASAPCHRCARKGRGWTYRSDCGKYHLHVACVSEMLVESWGELYYGRKPGFAPGNGIPPIRILSHHHGGARGKGKAKRCCELAAMAVQFVISAVLGDPAAAIAGVAASLLFR